MNGQQDGTSLLFCIVLVMLLVLLALILGILILNIIGLFLIGWYLTHLMVTTINQASDGQLIEEHSGLVLLASALCWACVAWVVVPGRIITALAPIWPQIADNTYVIPLIGAALGISWGVLVLFTVGDADDTTLDVSGMYGLNESDLMADEPDTIDLLADSVILGADIE